MRFKWHSAILCGLAGLAAALTVVIWLHPSLGYARGGILDGEDMRRTVIQLVWWLFAAFAFGATAVLAILPARWPRWCRLSAAYAAGIGSGAVALPILDHYY